MLNFAIIQETGSCIGITAHVSLKIKQESRPLLVALHLLKSSLTWDGEHFETLITAMHAVDQRLRLCRSKPESWQQLLRQAFGRSAPVALSGISVELLDSQTMAGLHGAYAHAPPQGDERIYLNADWLASANAAAVEAVLLEELGHAIDRRLNGSNDTAGDEGAIFSALIRGVAIPVVETTQNDHHTLIINGQRIAVEAAAPTLTTSASPQFTAIAANSGVPSGAVGTLVSALIDSGGSLNNFSDADGDSPAIAIIGTNLNGGTLYYSTNNGASWSDVGATAAFLIAQKQLGDVVMVDIVDGVPQGKALDMAQAGPVEMFDAKLTGSVGYEETADSDVVIITSGSPRKPGMTREDLLNTNAQIVASVAENVVKHSPNTVIVMLTNPLDIMTYHAWKVSGFPAERVVGQAGILDSARFRTFISMELDVSVEDITAMVMGGHGDTMVPLPRYTTVGGIPITQLISPQRIDEISDRTRNGGGEIVELLKVSGYYAAGASLAQMAEAIVLDKKRLIPCSAHLTGQYGIDDLYIGVPIILGADGIEKIVEIDLSSEELDSLHRSAATYREGIGVIGY